MTVFVDYLGIQLKRLQKIGGARGTWLVIILLLTVVAGLAVFDSRDRNVFYQGKPLRFWLETFAAVAVRSSPSSAERLEADDAVRHAGTNAIPTLLRLLRAHDSTLKLRMLGLAERQHVVKIYFVQAGELNYAASIGFRALGPIACDAVAAITETYDQNISYPSQLYSVDSLGDIGPSASNTIPALLRAAANTNWVVRGQAVEALGKIHAQPAVVVPVLIKTLSDAQTATRQRAAVALGMYGKDAESAISALLKASRDDPGIAWLASKALGEIGTNGGAGAGMKR